MKFLLWALFAFSYLAIHAQDDDGPFGKDLIGKPCPDFNFSRVLHYPGGKLSLAKLKGRPVVIDFWPTWCTPCVKALPRLDSLQHEFKRDIQLLSVCYNDEKRMKLLFSIMKKNKILKFQVLPTVYDTLLTKRFRQGNFYSVWIDAQGIVKYYSGASMITGRNLREFIATGKVTELDSLLKARSKRVRPLSSFSRDKGLLVGGNGGPDSSYIFRSILTGYQESISYGGLPGFISPRNSTQRVRAYNCPLKTLYYVAYRPPVCPVPLCGDANTYGTFLGEPVIRVKDSSIFKYYWNHPDKDSNAMHRYCYELTYPEMPATLTRDTHDLDSVRRLLAMIMDTTMENPYQYPTVHSVRTQKIVQQDLENYFGYKAGIEKVKYPCLNIIVTDPGKKIETKGATPVMEYSDWHIKMKNQSLSQLIFVLWFKNQFSGFVNLKYGFHKGYRNIFIDKTGILGNIDISMDCDMTDLESVKTELSKFGLGIEEGEIELYAVVIRDKD